jgi:polyhydroxybutyrate depolymerase
MGPSTYPGAVKEVGLFVLVVVMAVGCGSSDGVSGSAGAGGVGGTGGQDFSSNPPLVIGTEARPASVDIPTDYDPGVTYPMLLLLHGAGADGRTQAGYFQLFTIVDEKQFVMIYPDAKADEEGRRAWDSTGTDDVEYLSALIEEAKQIYNIDRKRVYLMGHSSGGFMSLSMACAASELFTALVSLAGGTYEDPNDCQPAAQQVSVLVVHGTNDETVPYEGVPGVYAGAVEIVDRFATAGGCDTGSPTAESSVDLVPALEGAETDRISYSNGCDEGIDAALWTINDGPHISFFSQDYANLTTDWLFRHSR